jgi:hypothetical protein
MKRNASEQIHLLQFALFILQFFFFPASCLHDPSHTLAIAISKTERNGRKSESENGGNHRNPKQDYDQARHRFSNVFGHDSGYFASGFG